MDSDLLEILNEKIKEVDLSNIDDLQKGFFAGILFSVKKLGEFRGAEVIDDYFTFFETLSKKAKLKELSELKNKLKEIEKLLPQLS